MARWIIAKIRCVWYIVHDSRNMVKPLRWINKKKGALCAKMKMSFSWRFGHWPKLSQCFPVPQIRTFPLRDLSVWVYKMTFPGAASEGRFVKRSSTLNIITSVYDPWVEINYCNLIHHKHTTQMACLCLWKKPVEISIISIVEFPKPKYRNQDLYTNRLNDITA